MGVFLFLGRSFMAAAELTGLPNPSNITTVTYVEDITPIDPHSSAGGYGSISATVELWDESRFAVGTETVLVDDRRGRVPGTIRGVEADTSLAHLTIDSELGKFNVMRRADSFVGNLSELIQYYMNLSGIYAPLQFDATDRQVAAPGFVGNVWDRIKQLLSAEQVEMTLLQDSVVVRNIRGYETHTDNLVDISEMVNTQNAALAVEVIYYSNRSITNGEVYPVPSEEPSILTVEAGEISTWEIGLDASLTSVNQPEHVYMTGPGNKSGTNGVYTVVGNDNLPIQPAQWAAAGGRLWVEIGADTSMLRIHVEGANISHLAPFRIAMSAGGHDYNSLHVTGTGVAWNARNFLLYTGANPMTVSEQIGATVDNPYLTTASQAFSGGQHTAAAFSGLEQTISGTLVGEQLETQVFGRLIGLRMRIGEAYFRVTSVNTGDVTTSFEAISDTTIADFNSVWSDQSTEAFNEQFENMSMKDFSLAPLWRDKDVSEGHGYGSGPYGSNPYGD